MKTVDVIIEERLSRTTTIEIKDDEDEFDAIEKAKKMYFNEEIVLDSNDFYYREIGTDNIELKEF